MSCRLPSTTIIAFPRPKLAPEGATPAAPERLQRALAALELALAEQRSAVAKWRQSLGELHGSVQGLGEASAPIMTGSARWPRAWTG